MEVSGSYRLNPPLELSGSMVEEDVYAFVQVDLDNLVPEANMDPLVDPEDNNIAPSRLPLYLTHEAPQRPSSRFDRPRCYRPRPSSARYCVHTLKARTAIHADLFGCAIAGQAIVVG